jgi:hypothetical protein
VLAVTKVNPHRRLFDIYIFSNSLRLSTTTTLQHFPRIRNPQQAIMSMSQIEPHMRHCPLAVNVQRPPPKFAYHFVYDYRQEKFKKLLPNAEKLTVGWLPGWIWHINVDGMLCGNQAAFIAHRI